MKMEKTIPLYFNQILDYLNQVAKLKKLPILLDKKIKI